MAGFKRLPDGGTGQAELMGSTRPGDVLAEVGGVVVSDMSFDKVRGMFETLRVVLDSKQPLPCCPGRKQPPYPCLSAVYTARGGNDADSLN